MDKTGEGNEQTKKCFCARCFLPIDPEDKVDIDGQNFHKFCSMCCICRTIPTSLKMFYGHVFCNECFKTHVLNKFRGEPPRMHSNSWWMRWAPGAKPQESQPDAKIGDEEKDTEQSEEPAAPPKSEEPCKKCICARCLQAVDEAVKVDIGGQSFHPQCARCYFCHTIPKDKVKIYYGQVFCEECFHRYVMARGKDTPAEHFKACFDQWQNNPQARKSDKIMTAASPNRSASSESLCTWELSFEGRSRTDGSDLPHSNSRESANQENVLVAAAEKIEKLTKYLQDNSDSEKCSKKWKNYVVEYENDTGCVSGADRCAGWVDLQNPKVVHDEVNCPKCLWQCGPIFVNGEHFQKEVVCCGDCFE